MRQLTWGGVVAGGVLALSLLAGQALAQPSDRPGKGGDPLKGPPVKDRGVPGEPRRLSGGGGGDRRENVKRDLPHPVFMRAFEALRGDSVAEGLRLTEAQEDSIRVLNAEYLEEMDTYREKHKDEVKALRGDLAPEDRRKLDALMRGMRGPQGERPGRPDGERPGRPDGKRPGKPGEKPEGAPPAGGPDGMMDGDAPMEGGKPDPEKAAAAREKVKAIIEGAPKASDAHVKMMAILSAEQRAEFDKSLAKVRAEFDKRNDPREIERAREKGKGGKDAPAPALKLDDPRIPERLRERIKQMPAERQQEALRRLERRLESGKPLDADTENGDAPK